LFLQDFGASTCGGSYILEEVDKKLLLTSPNYPNKYTSNLRCNFLIKVSFQE